MRKSTYRLSFFIEKLRRRNFMKGEIEMAEWTKGFRELNELMDSYLERADKNGISNKYRGDVIQFIGTYYEMSGADNIKAALGEAEFAKLRNSIFQMQTSVEENNTDLLRQNKAVMLEIVEREENKVARTEMLTGIFQSDIQQMNIHDEKIKMCQGFVDLDIKIYGEITEETLQVLDVQNVTVVNGIVEEKPTQAFQKSEHVADNSSSGVAAVEEAAHVTGDESPAAAVDVMEELKRFTAQHKADMELMKQGTWGTLVVNAYAGPGAGKTTACLATVAELKKMGYVAEYVSEYAKELVYDNPQLLDGALENQYAILKEQIHRLDRFMGGVDIIVTDSPILLNTIYGKDLPEEYASLIKELYGHYDNFNFFVKRGEDFVQEGRVQNQEESIQKDEEIKKLLKDNQLFFGTFNHETVSNLASKIEITYKRLFGAIEAEQSPAQKSNDTEKAKPVNNETTHNESRTSAATSEAVSASDNKTTQSYKGICYEKVEGQSKSKPIIIYGDSPEQIVEKVRGWNRTRTDKMKLDTCYVRKLNPETNKYENPAKYEVATGLDITPIYLNLPHLAKTEYMKLVNELKSNGAKYNPVEKAFFVTKQADLNLFRDYLPIAGTQAEIGENRSRNKLPYEIESGKDVYDNRVKITIEGMEPINIYGDSYGVHFPSLSAAETKEIVEKFILPGLEPEQSRPKQENIEYNGKTYERSQYNVILKAKEQHFTKEQIQMLERPELTSDRLNEIRFAIKDGLTPEQIAQFATPDHEQWQMDLCRTGMQHGLTYDEIKPLMDAAHYKKEDWALRRDALGKMIKDKNIRQRPSTLAKLHANEKIVAEREAARDKPVPERELNVPVAEK